MEDPTSKGRHELNLASRKAEEPAWRRFQATRWLDSLVGSLGMSTQPTEREFISCLRNGLVLCNVINKIKPGSVPKVVEIHSASQVPTWDSQPLPAYQYFENIRNFLVAVEELKLPAFEASDLERDNLEVGSSAKVVDCILALKAYHECKQTSGGHGFFTSPRSPMVMHSASRIHSRASGAISSDPCRKLDMSTACNSLPPPESGTQNLEGNIQVYCRIRPAFSAEARSVVDVIGEDGSLVVLDPLKPQKDGRKNFQFNRVFGPTATQDEIFKDTQPLIRSVMDGYNVCIFAYGQTGSGKTHTMCGPSGGLTKDRGIHYRALTDLLQLSNKRTDTVKYDIHVQMVEIYNEQVRDLLAEDSTTTKYPFLLAFP